MKWFLFSCAMAVVTFATAHNNAKADGRIRARTPHPAPVHVGHAGPYCLYYLGRYGGRVSPYRYFYSSRTYPRYYGGTHTRVMQNLGTSPGDVGFRGTAW